MEDAAGTSDVERRLSGFNYALAYPHIHNDAGNLVYVEGQEIPDAIRCSTCHYVVMNPVRTGTCDHLYCRTCITKSYRAGSKSCVVCYKAIFLSHLKNDETTNAIVKKLMVFCTNKPNGCEWKGTRESMEEHHKTSCAGIRCTHALRGCMKMGTAEVIAAHTSNECEFEKIANKEKEEQKKFLEEVKKQKEIGPIVFSAPILAPLPSASRLASSSPTAVSPAGPKFPSLASFLAPSLPTLVSTTATVPSIPSHFAAPTSSAPPAPAAFAATPSLPPLSSFTRPSAPTSASAVASPSPFLPRSSFTTSPVLSLAAPASSSSITTTPTAGPISFPYSSLPIASADATPHYTASTRTPSLAATLHAVATAYSSPAFGYLTAPVPALSSLAAFSALPSSTTPASSSSLGSIATCSAASSTIDVKTTAPALPLSLSLPPWTGFASAATLTPAAAAPHPFVFFHSYTAHPDSGSPDDASPRKHDGEDSKAATADAAPVTSLSAFLPVSRFDALATSSSSNSESHEARNLPGSFFRSKYFDQLPPIKPNLLTAFPLAASDAAAPTNSLGALPTDIYVHILGFIPFRPRLLILRRICRKWNNAIVIGIRMQPDDFAAHRIMPPKTKQRYGGDEEASVLPDELLLALAPRVRSLSFPQGRCHMPKGAAECFTSLTELHLTDMVSSRDAIALGMELLPRNFNTLTHLSFPGVWALPAPPEGGQAKIPELPALRSLDISLQKRSIWEQFLPSFSRLTSLTLRGCEEVDQLPACPQLRSLALVYHKAQMSAACKWAHSLSTVTSLTLDIGFNNLADEVWGLLADTRSLVELRSSWLPNDLARLAEILPQHTKLRKLVLPQRTWSAARGAEDVLRIVHTRLRSLPLPHNCPNFVTYFTNLEKLHIMRQHIILLEQHEFPRLRSIALRPGHFSATNRQQGPNIFQEVINDGDNVVDLTDAMSFIHMVVHRFPTVTRIRLKVNSDRSELDAFFSALSKFKETLQKAASNRQYLRIEIKSSHENRVQSVGTLAKSQPWVQFVGTMSFF